MAMTGDSYIGSVISLTSKCDIRYEGVLFNINTAESTIGLTNVRSFGTEGRKKDGPQIPASEKIYEYILFRGSDIKDLQVKHSPPDQNASIHNDPAIIQSHYSRSPPSSTSFPSVGTGTIEELNSNTAPVGPPRPPFQSNLPLNQPGGSVGSWAPSPAPPTAVPSPMTMYWQGYFAPTGTLPHVQQASFMRPPPGLPMQYSATGALTSEPQNLQDLPSPLLPIISNPLSSTSVTTLSSTLTPSLVSPLHTEVSPSQIPTLFSSSLESVVSSNPMSVPIPNVSYQSNIMPISNRFDTSSANVSSFASHLASNSEYSDSNPRVVQIPNLSYSVGLSNLNQVETSVPLVTPDQLLPPSLSVVSSSKPPETGTEDAEVKPEEDKSKPLLPEPPLLSPADTKEPILPLPVPTHQRSNGAFVRTHQVGGGRGRGYGYSRPVTKFNEDFDFNAMNEKFNKDEVWGHLGKNKSEEDEEAYDIPYEDVTESSNSDKKPVYVKDDFFDALSSNTQDRESRNGRIRFSEQLKKDAETFGDFSRHHGGPGGGRGFRGARTRGFYYGRGYGYGGRGRGQSGPYRPF